MAFNPKKAIHKHPGGNRFCVTLHLCSIQPRSQDLSTPGVRQCVIQGPSKDEPIFDTA